MMQAWLAENWFKAGLLAGLLFLGIGVAVFALKYEAVPPAAGAPRIISIERATSTEPFRERLDVAAVVRKWYASIARIDCYLKRSQEDVSLQSGSGFLTEGRDGLRVLTNRHVLEDKESDAKFPELCEITLPGRTESYVATGGSEGMASDLRLSTSTLDWGYARISHPDPVFAKDLPQGLPFCADRRPLGTPVIILGYPAVGSKTDVTVTQGIISGYDGDYYISDAKIGHGSSGGVAIGIDLDSNESCLLGIPTFAEVGEIISLGRILDIQSVVREGALD